MENANKFPHHPLYMWDDPNLSIMVDVSDPCHGPLFTYSHNEEEGRLQYTRSVKKARLYHGIMSAGCSKPGVMHSLIFTTGFAHGIARIYFLKCTKEGNLNQEQDPAYIAPIKKFFKTEAITRMEYNVDMVMNRRKSPDSNDFLAVTSNTHIPVQHFVRIYKDTKNNTIESRKAWGTKMAQYCSEIGTSDKFMCKTKFVYSGDDTGDNFLPIANHFQDQDIIYLIRHMFPGANLPELANDSEFLKDFYNKDLQNHGKELLIHASSEL